MTNQTENWAGVKEAQQAEGRQRRQDADREFAKAAVCANEHGLTLGRCSKIHYQLKCSNWLLNIYPGNQRLKGDQKKKPPMIKINSPWTLTDVVNACIPIAPGPEEQTCSVKTLDSDTVQVTYSSVLHSTSKATLIDFGGQKIWFPISQIKLLNDSVIMPKWLACDKGIFQ